jgi:hypothetical protein
MGKFKPIERNSKNLLWKNSHSARTEVEVWMNIHAIEYATLLECESPQQKLVFMQLAAFCHPDTLACFPGQKALSQRCALSSRQVQRLLIELEGADKIRRAPQFAEHGGRATDSYVIVGLYEFLCDKHLTAQEAWAIAHSQNLLPSGQGCQGGDDNDVRGGSGQGCQGGDDNDVHLIRTEEEPPNNNLKTTCKNDQNAAPEIALASTDAGDWREDSIFPAGPFIRVRSMTAAERAERLKVTRRSEVDAEWERLTHPREYVDEYEIDPGVDDDLIAAPIGNPEHQTNLSYMAFPETFVTGPRIELETSDSEFAASVGEAIKKDLIGGLRLSTAPVDNPERQSESILMAFPEPFVKKTRIGETTTIAPTTKPDLESKAAEKKETQQQPTATPEGTPAVVICKEGAQMEEFTLTAISPAKPKANRKRKTAATNDAFDIFWAAYPRKQDKQPAKKIWARLSQTDREAAIAAIPNYKLAHLGREQYLRMGSTYLSKATWEGYLPEPAASDATVAQTQETQTAPQSKHAARNALGAKKHPGDPYFGFGAQKLESLLNYRATGFWVGGNPNSQYDWWEGEEFEPELVALAKRVELGEVLFDDAMNSVRPVAKPLPQRPQLRVVR